MGSVQSLRAKGVVDMHALFGPSNTVTGLDNHASKNKGKETVNGLLLSKFLRFLLVEKLVLIREW